GCRLKTSRLEPTRELAPRRQPERVEAPACLIERRAPAVEVAHRTGDARVLELDDGAKPRESPPIERRPSFGEMLPRYCAFSLKSGQQTERHLERVAERPVADVAGPCFPDELLQAQRALHVPALVRSDDPEIECTVRQVDVGIRSLERGEKRLDP